MKNICLILLICLTSTAVYSQTEIVATIIDSTGVTLPGANAVLLNASDSLLVGFGTTDDKGVFRMQDIKPGDYLLRVSFIGYERPDQPLKITASDQYLGLGELKMYPAGFFLNGVEVTADRIPIRMKGDTMLYDAGAFGVSENAVVEDLLRRLPGMTVDANGQITWRGKPISEVMINGKPFFGGNTTLLTQNLDAKAVKNVEVFDQKSDEEEVTGVDDGQENITVNLETKEEFKAKLFGDIYAGYGTKERYQAGGKGFRISDATQWGVLGTINNINQVGFSGDEISGFNSSSGRGGGGFRVVNGGGGSQTEGLQRAGDNATGQNRSIAAGLNFGQTVGKDGQLTADYALFDRQQTQITNSLQSFNRATDNRIIETDEVNAADSYRHSFGVELRQKVDSLGRLRINANLNLAGGDNENQSFTTVRNPGAAEEDFRVSDNNVFDQNNGRIRAGFNTRLSKTKQRTFGLRAGASFDRNQTDADLLTDGLDDGGTLDIAGALINGFQRQDRLTNSFSVDGEVRYGEPIAERWNLETEVAYNYDNDEGDYRFNFNENTKTNLLDRTWQTVRSEIGLEHRFTDRGNFSFGASYLAANLALAGDTTLDRGFNYLLPYARYRNRLEKGFLGITFSTGVDEPSIAQLQTIARPNVNGRVNLGNPALTPSQTTSFNTFLWYNDQFRAISANGSVGINYTDDAFGNEVTFLGGQQIFRTVNVSHAWNGYAYLGTTIGMAFMNGQMELGGNGNYSRGQGFVDEVTRLNTNVSVSGNINLTTEFNEDSYLTVGYDLTNRRNTFDDVESVTTVQTVHSISADLGLEFNPTWRFETRFAYNLFAENDFTEQQSIADMRVALEIRPFKKAGHYFRLSGSDLFDQNRVINQFVNQFVTTSTRNDALGIYFLGTFFYKL